MRRCGGNWVYSTWRRATPKTYGEMEMGSSQLFLSGGHENVIKMRQQLFRLSIRKTFFLKAWSNAGVCPEILCSPYQLRFPRSSWLKPWESWSVPMADPVLSRYLEQRPAEVLSLLNYSIVLWLKWLSKPGKFSQFLNCKHGPDSLLYVIDTMIHYWLWEIK